MTSTAKHTSTHLSCIDAVLKLGFITLLLKKDGAANISGFHPVSLVHGLGKIFLKTLGPWLAHKLDTLIAANRSVYIREKSIQNNFIPGQQVVEFFHCKCAPAFVLKMDIVEAFDFFSWPFLLVILHSRASPIPFCGWSDGVFTARQIRICYHKAKKNVLGRNVDSVSTMGKSTIAPIQWEGLGSD